MGFNKMKLLGKLRLLGEEVITSNSFGVISQDDKGYKVYVADKNGDFNNAILSKRYKTFAVFDNFIIMTEDIECCGRVITHKAIFVDGLNYDIVSRYKETDVWARVRIQDRIQLGSMIKNYIVHNITPSLIDVQDVIGVTSSTRALLVNYKGDIFRLPNKSDNQIMGINYRDGEYKVLYICRQRGNEVSIGVKEITRVDRDLNIVERGY